MFHDEKSKINEPSNVVHCVFVPQSDSWSSISEFVESMEELMETEKRILAGTAIEDNNKNNNKNNNNNNNNNNNHNNKRSPQPTGV